MMIVKVELLFVNSHLLFVRDCLPEANQMMSGKWVNLKVQIIG